MTVSTDGADAVSVWMFCAGEFPAGAAPVTRTKCDVPAIPKVFRLAVGPGWLAADDALLDETWSALTWDLFVDGRRVDLAAFGTSDRYVSVSSAPAKLRSWNVVLERLRPGAHVVRAVVYTRNALHTGFQVVPAGRYELVATFHVPTGGSPLL